ncbi:MAG TPA: hypothetical protein VLB01_01515 [Thermodesulfobacteriota bacterium]|nr:hypothetical protein [Thermodesulfobacteriota bacterium]
MKRFFILLCALFLFWACASPSGDGIVKLDGPILESVNSEGNLEFNGVVMNTGDVPVRSVYVVIVLRDQKGNVIEANSIPITEENSDDLLHPSERAFFNLSIKSGSQKMASKEVEIYYEKVKDLPGSS